MRFENLMQALDDDPIFAEWYESYTKQQRLIEQLEEQLENERWILDNIASAEPEIRLTPHAADRACASAGDGETETRAAADV